MKKLTGLIPLTLSLFGVVHGDIRKYIENFLWSPIFRDRFFVMTYDSVKTYGFRETSR